MLIWSDIERALAPTREDKELAAELAAGVGRGLPLAVTQSALIAASDAAIASLYATLETRSSPTEPRRLRGDSSWMLEADFCWVNVRACASGDSPGTFVRAAKLLPAIASDAILLAPFHPTQFDLCYAPETMTMADPALFDRALMDAGVSAENQLRAFVSACRLLGKCVGYELLPYAAQFSRIAMERPQLFRWVALDDERTGLAHADPSFPYRSEDRLRDAEQVADMVTAAKEDYGISSFRVLEGDAPEVVDAKVKAYYSAIRLCADRGLWPVPAHARAGVGIPAFLRCDSSDDFPIFSYRDVDGADISEDAYSVVAPFAFYDDMPPNAIPTEPVRRNDEAIQYYAEAFSYWRDSFGFDFVRYNAADRVFSESVDDEGSVPSCDRPTREVVSLAIRESRDGAPGVGAISPSKGAETEAFGALGFDLLMGGEALRRVDAPLMRDAFALYDSLSAAKAGARRASVCFAVDLPESSAPRLWGSPLRRVMGPDRMRLRHVAARLVSVGAGRRPLFETMGFQDGSTGLYEAGLSVRGLDWANDAAFAAGYAAIERFYAGLRPFLASAAIAGRFVDDGLAWWQIRAPGSSRLLVVALSLETAEGSSPGVVSIPIDKALGELSGTAYRLPDLAGAPVDAAGSLKLELGFLDSVVVDLVPAYYR